MTSDTEHWSDDSLIARIAEGGPDAVTALFRRHQGAVYRFALHMSGSPTLAEDVTQDVFVTVMRDAARYQPGRSTVAAWLCGIARNCARQRLERDRRFATLARDADDESHLAPLVASDPVDELTRAERVAALRRAVLSLPHRYREVIVMCDLQELSYADAAGALGCAVGTVRSRLHRARSLLASRVLRMENSGRGAETVNRAAEQPAPRSEIAIGDAPKRCLA